MKNVTITLDKETARWARVEAARQGTSVSRLLGDMLSEYRKQETMYSAAMTRFMALVPAPIKSQGQTYPPRGDLYDRKVFR